MTVAELRAALANRNVGAFLRVIREGESGQDDAAYTIVNGGAHFTAPPWRHPYHGIPTTKGGKASGAYQFLGTTWARVADALGLGGDFSPASQDLGAVYLIAGRGALADVIAGNLVAAISRLRDEWVSLPGMGIKRAQETFIGYGGSYAPQATPQAPVAPEAPATTPSVPLQPESPVAPPKPQERRPMLPMLIPFILSLAQSFLQPKIAQALSKQGAAPDIATTQAGNITAAGTALLSGIVDSAVKHTGQEDAVAQATAANDQLALAQAQITALKAARDDAEKRAQVEADANALLDKIKPLVEQLDSIQRAEWEAEETSRDRAATRAHSEPWDMTKTLVYAGIGMLTVVMIAVFAFYGIQLWRDKPTSQMDTLIVQLVTAIIGIVLTIIAYRFGTSRSSAAKDELVAQLSARRPKPVPPNA